LQQAAACGGPQSLSSEHDANQANDVVSLHTPLKQAVFLGQQNVFRPPSSPHICEGSQQPPNSALITPPLAQHCSVMGSHSPVTQHVAPHASAALQQPSGPASPLGAYTWPGRQQPLGPARSGGQSAASCLFFWGGRGEGVEWWVGGWVA
jgi:hypothetical protein